MEQIIYKKTVIALKVSAIRPGSNPLTDGKEPMQVVALKHKRGAYLKAHAHRPLKRVTAQMQECLMVRKGKLKVDLYGPDKKLFKHMFLNAGQILIMMHGGLGIHVLQDAEFIEFKNGPFKEDKILI